MFDTEAVNALPEVASTVVGDRRGVLVEAVNEPDGEAIAAVSGYAATYFSEAGERLGLGTLSRLHISGGQQASLLFVEGDVLMSARVAPGRPLADVERKVDAVLAQGSGQ